MFRRSGFDRFIMNDLTLIEDDCHQLLEPPSPAYTNVTVRRAFIVWMYCGQQNKFKDVCNFYHCQEAFEDKLTHELRAASRHCEFDLFTNPPPTSPFLREYFPNLYPNTPITSTYIQKLESIKNEKCVFKLEGFQEMPKQHCTATGEIVDTSNMIRSYCKTKMISIRKFLEEFKGFARKCQINDTVTNVSFYIKRQMVGAELDMVANYPTTFSFLQSSDDSEFVVHGKENLLEIIPDNKKEEFKVVEDTDPEEQENSDTGKDYIIVDITDDEEELMEDVDKIPIPKMLTVYQVEKAIKSIEASAKNVKARKSVSEQLEESLKAMKKTDSFMENYSNAIGQTRQIKEDEIWQNRFGGLFLTGGVTEYTVPIFENTPRQIALDPREI